jgi:hypothetical protein
MRVTQSYIEKTFRTWRGRLSCSNADCRASHRMWKRISGPTRSIDIHGARYCFPDCFEQGLERLLQQFQTRQSRQSGYSGTSHRIPLGLLMLSRGDLNNNQLRSALKAQRCNGSGRIGEWIEKLGFASSQQITAALAAQCSCPVLRQLPTSSPDCNLPLVLLRHFRMVPVSYMHTTILMAFGGNVNYHALLALEKMRQCKTLPCITTGRELTILLSRFEEKVKRGDYSFAIPRTTAEMTHITCSYAAKLEADEVRAVVCGEYVWIQIEGSDSANLVFSQTLSSSSFSRTGRRSRIHECEAGQGQDLQELARPRLTPGATSLFQDVA